MEEPLKIVYSYRFDDGATRSFEIALNRKDLAIFPKECQAPPYWAELNRHKCDICSLDEKTHAHCPIALNLADISDGFKDYFAYENVGVTVTTEDRNYSKNTSLQEGLSALIGIVMVTSGCPVMEKLKPMVRFHLPFASLVEGIYRTVSMYLMAQYFLNKDGMEADWALNGLEDIYSRVGIVNRDFAKRLLEAAKKDANVNALVNLDCFASMAAISTEDTLNDIKLYFSSYFNRAD